MIPIAAVQGVKQAFAGRDEVEIREYDAGHAFDNHRAAWVHDPAAAAEAGGHTVGFLRQTL